ncbi:MAG: S8 family serine peptidase, partial [Candidatus Promineifilaceae bacterium]
LFQAIAGTSMSSPHIAGVMALMDQAHPDWSPAAVKSAIMTSASQDVVDNDRVSPATPFAMGAGQVNPGHHSVAGSPFQPGLVYDAGLSDYLGFLCNMDPSYFGDPDATCATLEGAGIPTTATNLNLASIGIAELAGSETVMRTVTSVANTADPINYSVSVDAPPGYMVEVSPSSFSIAAGEEVTFEVTISNASAPVNEWRFGSLTWTDSEGMYSVYSPIAVKASLIGVPSKLEGAGADGSGSFDVAFGYSGAYTAAAHGLVPAIVTRDNVLQDPDQEFDPADGYSNAHKFVVEDAAFLRFTLPPDAVSNPTEIDLDIFLLDPNGQEVASSTNGGTDEQIDVTLPENGTWTLYVHGWQTAGPSADYTLYTWIIPAAPGGSLSVGAAPDMAELATTGTVEYSWTGAPAEWNLGAISHTGTVGEEDAVLLGLTLIDVDNRP